MARSIRSSASSRDNLVAHYELNYDVREARTRRVYFLLPKRDADGDRRSAAWATPWSRNFAAPTTGPQRRWEVQLAERQIGRVRLAGRFPAAIRRRGPAAARRAAGGSDRRRVSVGPGRGRRGRRAGHRRSTSDRPARRCGRAGRGRLCQVGRRVIGAYGYVGQCRRSVLVNVSRREPYALPPALVQKAQLTTKVSAARAAAQSLAAVRPADEGDAARNPPAAGLDAVDDLLDDQPTKPQREGRKPARSACRPSSSWPCGSCKIVYEAPAQRAGLLGHDRCRRAGATGAGKAGTDQSGKCRRPIWNGRCTCRPATRFAGPTARSIPTRSSRASRQPSRSRRFLYELAGGVQPLYSGAESKELADIASNFRTMDSIRHRLLRRPSSPPSASTAATPPPMAPPMEGMVPQNGLRQMHRLTRQAAPPRAGQLDAPAAREARPRCSDHSRAGAPANPEAPATGRTSWKQPQDAPRRPATDRRRSAIGQVRLDLTLAGVSSLRIDMRAEHGGEAIIVPQPGGRSGARRPR